MLNWWNWREREKENNRRNKMMHNLLEEYYYNELKKILKSNGNGVRVLSCVNVSIIRQFENGKQMHRVEWFAFGNFCARWFW